MSTRAIKKYVAIENPAGLAGNTHVEIEVRYASGGLNYFTYKHVTRGYYAAVTPVKVEEREGGFSSVSFMAFSGQSVLLEEAKMFSAKKLATLGAQVLPFAEHAAKAFEAGEPSQALAILASGKTNLMIAAAS